MKLRPMKSASTRRGTSVATPSRKSTIHLRSILMPASDFVMAWVFFGLVHKNVRGCETSGVESLRKRQQLCSG